MVVAAGRSLQPLSSRRHGVLRQTKIGVLLRPLAALLGGMITSGDQGSPKPPASQPRNEDTTTQDAGGGRMLVVGLGASAGGIEALAQFFDAMPADSGAAFVVVLHPDPTRERHLPTTVQYHTLMPVVEAQDGVTIA